MGTVTAYKSNAWPIPPQSKPVHKDSARAFARPLSSSIIAFELGHVQNSVRQKYHHFFLSTFPLWGSLLMSGGGRVSREGVGGWKSSLWVMQGEFITGHTAVYPGWKGLGAGWGKSLSSLGLTYTVTWDSLVAQEIMILKLCFWNQIKNRCRVQ